MFLRTPLPSRKDQRHHSMPALAPTYGAWKTFPPEVVQAPFHIVLRLLRRVVDRTGVAVVGPHRVEDGFPLGLWVQYHRAEWRAKRLSYSRVQTLESLPGWSWHPFGSQFPLAVQRLREFVAREGHARIHHEHVEAGFLLGRWVNSTRARYKRGKLAPDKVRLLEEVPHWNWSGGGRDERHGIALAALRCYVKTHGHARVPALFVVDGFALGTWVKHRRVEWREGRLAAPLAKQLETLPGWTWSIRRRSRTKA